jgi:thiol-disulfide isomerase/thioredoxin
MHYRWEAIAALLAASAPALYAQAPTPPKTDRYAPELQKLNQQFNEGRQKVFEAYQKAPEKDRMKVYSDGMGKLSAELGPKFLALAKKAKGTPTGLRARMQHFGMLSGPNARPETLLALARQIVQIEGKNPDMARALSQFGSLRYQFPAPGSDKNRESLLALLLDAEKVTPFPGVKAQAMFERGQVLYDSGKKPEALALMKRTVAKYPTTGGGAQAKSVIFELENLQIGMVAPEVTGKDETGTAFKLSDYRGKVVVLDFWGFW